MCVAAAVPHLRADRRACCAPSTPASSSCSACASTPTRPSTTSRRGRCTYFPGVPTMWIALVNQPGFGTRDLSSLRCAPPAARALPAEVAARFEQAHRAAARRRLGHDRDLAGRDQPARRTGRRSPARSACRCPASRWTWSTSTTRAACCRRARPARSASAARTSRPATGTGRRRTPPPSSTAGS